MGPVLALMGPVLARAPAGPALAGSVSGSGPVAARPPRAPRTDPGLECAEPALFLRRSTKGLFWTEDACWLFGAPSFSCALPPHCRLPSLTGTTISRTCGLRLHLHLPVSWGPGGSFSLRFAINVHKLSSLTSGWFFFVCLFCFLVR